MGDQVTIVKLNIDENPETAMAYRVMSVPTLTIFKGGQPVKSVAGAKPKAPDQPDRVCSLRLFRSTGPGSRVLRSRGSLLGERA